jgi:hypothetical protein
MRPEWHEVSFAAVVALRATAHPSAMKLRMNGAPRVGGYGWATAMSSPVRAMKCWSWAEGRFTIRVVAGGGRQFSRCGFASTQPSAERKAPAARVYGTLG